MEEWPEEPTPIVGGGKCESCERFEQLFLVRQGDERFQLCRGCASVSSEKLRSVTGPDLGGDAA